MGTIASLAASLRAALDERDRINTEKSRNDEQIDGLKHSFRRAMQAEGQVEDGDAVKASGMTITLRRKWSVRYDPALWGGIVKWAVDSGRDYIVQRRLSDGKIMELVDLGVELPEGMEVETFFDLDTRRSAVGASPIAAPAST